MPFRGIHPVMGNRLKELRTAAGLTHDEAADAMGVSRGQYIKLERGERRLTSDYISKAAEVFSVQPGEVLTSKKKVPIVGYVGAGSAAHYYNDGQGPYDDDAPMPENGTDDTVAVEIRGTSLGFMFDQWLVYYDEVHHPPTHDMLGRLCVVELIDGKVLVKKLVRGSAPRLYNLISQTEEPMIDQEVVWAAKVTAMTPR